MIPTSLFTDHLSCASSKHNLYLKKESAIFTNLIVNYEFLPLLHINKEKSNSLIRSWYTYYIIHLKGIMPK